MMTLKPTPQQLTLHMLTYAAVNGSSSSMSRMQTHRVMQLRLPLLAIKL
jgi:hypothetical protein